MDTMSNIEDRIFNFVKENTHASSTKINSQTLLFKEGIFDSMAFVLLIDFIEENFDVRPQDEDLIELNFESVDAITKFILRKKSY